MTPQQITTIEKYRGFNTKIAVKSLYTIYDEINGTAIANSDCWCSTQTRQTKLNEFYQWYEQLNQPTNDASN